MSRVPSCLADTADLGNQDEAADRPQSFEEAVLALLDREQSMHDSSTGFWSSSRAQGKVQPSVFLSTDFVEVRVSETQFLSRDPGMLKHLALTEVEAGSSAGVHTVVCRHN